MGIIPKSGAKLSNQRGQAPFGDECAGPQPVLEIGFRDGARRLVSENRQELERLGREMGRLACPQELPARLVQGEIAKRDRHDRFRESLDSICPS